MAHKRTHAADLLPAWGLDLRRDGGSPLTQTGYLRDVSQCFAWLTTHLGHPPRLLDLRCKAPLQAWIDDLREEKQHKPATVGRKAQALRSFLSFLEEEKLLDGNVGPKLKVPARDRTLPAFLTLEETDRLLQAPLTFAPPKLLARDLLIGELLYGSGLRCQELADLNIPHAKMDHDQRAVDVFVEKGKGRKARWVPCGPVVYEALQVYLRDRPALLKLRKGQDCGALLLSERGRRMSRGLIYQTLRKYGELVGVHAYPHELRHSCGVHMRSAGAGIESIRDHLGHDTLEMALWYAQCDLTKKRADAAKFHPRFAARIPRGLAVKPAPSPVPALPAPPPQMTPEIRDYVASLLVALGQAVAGQPVT